jgi:hypothetical protein
MMDIGAEDKRSKRREKALAPIGRIDSSAEIKRMPRTSSKEASDILVSGSIRGIVEKIIERRRFGQVADPH